MQGFFHGTECRRTWHWISPYFKGNESVADQEEEEEEEEEEEVKEEEK